MSSQESIGANGWPRSGRTLLTVSISIKTESSSIQPQHTAESVEPCKKKTSCGFACWMLLYDVIALAFDGA